MRGVDPKVVILFGAGASHGCGGVRNHPPLAKDLHRELASQSPIWSHIPTAAQEIFDGGDFEAGMAMLHDCQMRGEIDNLTEILRDQTIYFSRFRIDRMENNQYWKLINKYQTPIKDHRIVLATLNYDCLIERAAFALGMRVTYWGTNPGLELLKPHGSCNFFVMNYFGQGRIILGNLTAEGQLEPVHPDHVEARLAGTPLPTAMSLFNIEKTDLVCPQQIQEIRVELSHCLQTAKLIVIVGVRPRIKGDDHIWAPIKIANGDVAIVDRESLVEEWHDQCRPDRDDPSLPTKFMDAFPEMCRLVDSRTVK